MVESTVIHIRISRKLKDAIDAQATDLRRRSTDLIRMLLEDTFLATDEANIHAHAKVKAKE